MRLTLPTATVLEALVHGHGYGFEVVEVTGIRAGTVYPVLRRLEEHGYVRSSWEDPERARREGRPSRRNYELTSEGRRLAVEAAERYPGVGRMFGPRSLERPADA
ncbi:MAG: PadR family transcriptional regulator [Gemmatimonadota bacterium]